MRLQRVESRRVGNRTYHKFVLTLPEEIVTAVGWQAGADIRANVQGRSVVLNADADGATAKSRRVRSEYETFRDGIRSLLERQPVGLAWTEIRGRLKLSQKVPNNVWVRRMEAEIGLLRVKASGAQTLWKLAKA